MIKRKINFLLFTFSIILFLFFYGLENYDMVRIKKRIKEIDIQKTNQVKYDYLEIPSLKLKQIIVKGMTLKNLDKNYITTDQDLNTNEAIILAGHSVKGVFGSLYQIQKGSMIYINHTKKYMVTKKKIIEKNEIKELSNAENTINLITCTPHPNKRILVIGKLQY